MTETKPRISLNERSLAIWNVRQLERLRYSYDLKPEDTVIDLGAYKGEWSEEIFKRFGCRIIAVEPTEYIRNFPFAEVINAAAGTHNGKMQFGGRAYYTSIMEPGDHEYDCIDINPVIEKNNPIALLKINIEGSEYDILNHIIGAGLHKQIKNIQVQFHEIAGVPYELWYKEITEQLGKTHKLKWRYPFVWENWELL